MTFLVWFLGITVGITVVINAWRRDDYIPLICYFLIVACIVMSK
jgi:hypothetical protein